MKKILFTLILFLGLIITSIAQNSTEKITVTKENNLVIIRKNHTPHKKNNDQSIGSEKIISLTIQKENSPIIIKTTGENEKSSKIKIIIYEERTAFMSKNKKIIKSNN